MQPQFIIDVIKYVIRESRGENVNDELRAMDDRIRGTTLGEDLDLLLDTGELTRSLLAELWAKFKFKRQDQELMLDLMKDFKLLRKLGNNGKDERYVVPAMLPTRNLPPKFLEPRWWQPSRANAAARIEEDGAHRPAAFRIMYQVLGGQLPFSFMAELQVSLAQSEEAGDADLQQHFAPERSVEVEEERVGGSVLCERRGNAKEWVVLSHHHGCRPAHAAGAGAADNSGASRAPVLRVMAWVELMDEPSQPRQTGPCSDMSGDRSGMPRKKCRGSICARWRAMWTMAGRWRSPLTSAGCWGAIRNTLALSSTGAGAQTSKT